MKKPTHRASTNDDSCGEEKVNESSSTANYSEIDMWKGILKMIVDKIRNGSEWWTRTMQM